MSEYYKATITVNYACNNKCYWCYARGTNSSKRVMPIENLKKCIKTICELDIRRCQLIGGEPLIYPHIVECVRLLDEAAIEIFIATNGRMLANQEFFKKITQYNIKSFDLSIQGLSREEYKNNTGVDGFGDYLKAVSNLKEKNIHFVNTFVITRLDKYKIMELLSFCREYEIDNIIFEFEKGVVGENNCNLKVDECAKFVEVIYNTFAEKGIKFTIETSFPICLIPKEVLKRLIADKCISTACHVQRKNVLTIDPECFLLPCSAFVDYRFEDSQVILEGAKKTNEFMDSVETEDFYSRSRVYPSYKCVDCEYWDLCGGGCFVRWFFENPREVIKPDWIKTKKLSDLLSSHNSGTTIDAPESMRNPYTGIDTKY